MSDLFIYVSCFYWLLQCCRVHFWGHQDANYLFALRKYIGTQGITWSSWAPVPICKMLPTYHMPFIILEYFHVAPSSTKSLMLLLYLHLFAHSWSISSIFGIWCFSLPKAPTFIIRIVVKDQKTWYCGWPPLKWMGLSGNPTHYL